MPKVWDQPQKNQRISPGVQRTHRKVASSPEGRSSRLLLLPQRHHLVEQAPRYPPCPQERAQGGNRGLTRAIALRSAITLACLACPQQGHIPRPSSRATWVLYRTQSEESNPSCPRGPGALLGSFNPKRWHSPQYVGFAILWPLSGHTPYPIQHLCFEKRKGDSGHLGPMQAFL